MAHFKRGKCRYHQLGGGYANYVGGTAMRARLGLKPVILPDDWWNLYPRGSHERAQIWPKWHDGYLCRAPRWHDILFHTRPHRRANRRMEHKVLTGADPDDLSWPVSRKPHKYYW